MFLNNYQCESSQNTECLNQFNSPKNKTLFNKLMLHLSKLLQFDSLVVSGYQDDSQPVFSFRSQSDDCEELMPEQDLVTSSYAYDAFDSKHSTRSIQGVFCIEDALSAPGEIKDYNRNIRLDNSDRGELAMMLPHGNRMNIPVIQGL